MPQLIEQIAMRVSGPEPVTIAATIEAVRVEAMASAGVVDLTPAVEVGDMLRKSDGRPVHLPPSAVRYTTSRHLLREVEIVDWARTADSSGHRAVGVDAQTLAGLAAAQAAAMREMLTNPRPVIAVVGPAGSGKTRMLAAAVASWRSNGVPVVGAGPSAAAAQALHDGAGLASDTLHKLVHEHSTKQRNGQGPPGPAWELPTDSVVVIDEAGMVDTRLLHEYAQIAQAKNWRTVLVGDHRQLDSVDAGGMFAELVHDPDVVTVELDTLHRFEHEWEADASLSIRDGDPAVVDTYGRQGRIHGHSDQTGSVEAVAAAIAGVLEGRDVLVMAATNAVVDVLNATITDRLLDAGWLDPQDRIELGGCVFHPGQPVVTRANDRRLAYGLDGEEWVRNGDRSTVNAGTRDELYLTNLGNGHRYVLPVDYVAAGNVTVDYASTINRAQGATVDEAHLIIDERTNAKQLYVGTTRGRSANHIHTAPPAFDPDQHGPIDQAGDWTATGSVIATVERQPDEVSATARRRQLRELSAEARGDRLECDGGADSITVSPPDAHSERIAASMRRLQHFRRRPSRGIER